MSFQENDRVNVVSRETSGKRRVTRTPGTITAVWPPLPGRSHKTYDIKADQGYTMAMFSANSLERIS